MQELVFLAFVIIPVYGVTLAIDAIILNSIEFWSGNIPMAMEEGEIEEQIVQQNGNTYKITATKNKFHVEQLDGQKQKIAKLNLQEDAVKLFKPNGDEIHVVAGTSKSAAKAAVQL